jgi:hypothetical protein
MTIILPRVARTRWIPQYVLRPPRSAIPRSKSQMSPFSCYYYRRKEAHSNDNKNTNSDPRINDLGRAIEDDFATIRETYGTLPSSSQYLSKANIRPQQRPNTPSSSPTASSASTSYASPASSSQACTTGAASPKPCAQTASK